MNAIDTRPIICVEDSDEDFFAITHALRAAAVSNPIERCSDGRLARKLLLRSEGCAVANEAALILLDLNLPGVHGCDLLLDLRHRNDVPLVPVIVLSTSARETDVERCYLGGANAYLVKPLALEELEAMMAAVAKFWLHFASPAPRHRCSE